MRPWMVSILTCAALFTASPSTAGVTELGSSVDDIVSRQSVGLESAFFGHGIPGDPYGYVVTIQPFVGGYGDDGVLSGAGVSWHTTRLMPWDAGVSVGVMDLDLHTLTVAVSSGAEVWRGDHSALTLEGAFGYQFLAKDVDTAIRLTDWFLPGTPGDLILLDSFDLFHLMAHAVYTLDVWRVHPLLDVAWVGTWYRLDGARWDGGFPIVTGESADDGGGTTKVTVGLGAAVDVGRTILFGGVRVVDDAAIFQANLGLRF